MNASTRVEAFSLRRLAPISLAAAAIAVIALGASPLPARAATAADRSHVAKISTGATRLVVRVNRGINATTNRYSTYATSNVAAIDAIIRRVDALPKAPSTDEMCPMDVGATLTLSFYRASATPYAIVIADPGGCGPVTIRDYNANDSLKDSALLGGGAGLSAFVATQLHITSLQAL
jgi:hypothetical protein